MVILRIRDLVFLTGSVNTTVSATLYGVKSKNGSENAEKNYVPFVE